MRSIACTYTHMKVASTLNFRAATSRHYAARSIIFSISIPRKEHDRPWSPENELVCFESSKFCSTKGRVGKGLLITASLIVVHRGPR